MKKKINFVIFPHPFRKNIEALLLEDVQSVVLPFESKIENIMHYMQYDTKLFK